jgi:Zn-dependent protease with chaperone function
VALGVVLGLVCRGIVALGLTAPVMQNAYAVLEGPGRNAALVGVSLVLILPVLMPPPIAWAWLRAKMLRPAVQPWPSMIGVRVPAFADAEEHQFSNIVEELALAAGLPVPTVGIIDDAAPNLAVFGRAHDDAAVVATRGLLDTLDRSDTQALVAHAIGSIGNGDLRVAASLLAVYRSVGLFMALVALPVSSDARRAVFGLFGGDPDTAFALLDAQIEGRDRLGRLLLWLPMLFVVPGVTFALVGDKFSGGKATPWAALLPCTLLLGGAAILFYGLVRLTLGIWTIVILRWPLALVWRTRRTLADATAVQLAGDPDALSGALRAIGPHAAIPPGCGLWAHLFVCKPAGVVTGIGNLEPDIDSRLTRLLALGAAPGEAVRAAEPGHATLGIAGVILFFLIVNWKLSAFILAIGLGALLVMSGGAGLLIFTAIMTL